MTDPAVDVLIPTFCRPAALSVTLTSLSAQTFRDYRVVISDQTENGDLQNAAEVQAVQRVLNAHGNPVDVRKHVPRRGMAEQRQFLLDQVEAPYALYLDDDLILSTMRLFFVSLSFIGMRSTIHVYARNQCSISRPSRLPGQGWTSDCRS